MIDMKICRQEMGKACISCYIYINWQKINIVSGTIAPEG